MNKITLNDLLILQNYPLELKIQKSIARINEWVSQFGEDGVYISFSGGKDSTVLLHLIREVCGYKNIPAVFVDTGLEYPEIKQHIKSFDNVTIIKPKMSFKQVLDQYGYPIISKEQSSYIYQIRNTKSDKLRDLRLNGNKDGGFKLSKKWKPMLDSPFKISNKCCDVMKKNPVKKYEKETGRTPFTGTLACESNLRKVSYIKNGGCNAFNSKRPISTPLGFWTENDIYEYIKKYNLSIPSVYGDIIQTEEGKYQTTGLDRTGCVFCMYGCQAKDDNRFELLKEKQPKLYKYCMEKLKLKDVIDYMNENCKTNIKY